MRKRVRRRVATDTTSPQRGESDDADARLQRIIDLQEEAKSNPNALESCLGSVNGDLFLIERRLMQALDDLLNGESQSADELMMTQSVFDQHLRVAKQIDRFTQLDIKLRATREKAEHDSRGHRPR